MPSSVRVNCIYNLFMAIVCDRIYFFYPLLSFFYNTNLQLQLGANLNSTVGIHYSQHRAIKVLHKLMIFSLLRNTLYFRSFKKVI